MRRVTFIGAGAGKSGTTWLYACLDEHPEVFVPREKELDFFSWHYSRGLDWYHRKFAGADDAGAIGEISPSYMYTDRVPERIREYNPAMQLLFLLRNPIERAYSHYCMHLYSGSASEDIDAELGPQSAFVVQGLYYQFLCRFLEHFPRSQLHIVLYEDVVARPDAVIQGVYRFLGVTDAFRPPSCFRVQHRRKPRSRIPAVSRRLVAVGAALERRGGIAGSVVTFLRRRGYSRVLHRVLGLGARPYPVLSPAKMRELSDFYRDDVYKLSGLLERDLTSWLTVDEPQTHGPSQRASRLFN